MDFFKTMLIIYVVKLKDYVSLKKILMAKARSLLN